MCCTLQDEELQTDPVLVLHRLPPHVAAAPALQLTEGAPALLGHLPGLPQLRPPHRPHHLPRPGRTSPTDQPASVSLLEQRGPAGDKEALHSLLCEEAQS